MLINSRISGFLSLALLFTLSGVVGCNDGQFSGAGNLTKTERNSGKKGGDDAKADGPEDDNAIPGDSNSNGIPDSEEDLNNNGIPDGEEDGKTNSDPNSTLDDGGSSNLELYANGSIVQTKSDEDPNITIELMDPKDTTKVLKSVSVKPKKKGTLPLEKMCMKGKDTVWRVSFSGDQTRVLGRRDKCTFLYSSGGTNAEFGVDANGGDGLFGIGDCKAHEDDDYRVTCPDAKTLKVDAT